MKTLLIITGLSVAVFFIIRLLMVMKYKNSPIVADHSKILKLNEQNFQHQLKNKVVLIDFWAEWCVPCKMMAPVLNDVAEKLIGNHFVGKVNIEQAQSLAQKYNVRSIPTLILFKNGAEVDRFVGIKQKDFLLKQIQKV